MCFLSRKEIVGVIITLVVLIGLVLFMYGYTKGVFISESMYEMIQKHDTELRQSNIEYDVVHAILKIKYGSFTYDQYIYKWDRDRKQQYLQKAQLYLQTEGNQ